MRDITELAELDDGFIQDPHAVLALLRAEGPVRPVLMPGLLKVWLVTSHADARALLADPRVCMNGPTVHELLTGHASKAGTVPPPAQQTFDTHMLNTDPPDHTRLRNLVNKAFTARTVTRMRPRIEEITDDLLTGMSGMERVDLVADYALPLPITVICELLGVPASDQRTFREWSTVFVTAASPAQVHLATTRMAGYLSTLIATKRVRPAQDLLSDLIRVTDADDRLSSSELLSMAYLLLLAGHETTTNLIANGVLSLLSNPGQLAALRADPGLLPGAVEELLRFDGAVNLAAIRYTAAPVDVAGVRIPAGEFVMISLLGANRDATRFPDPDTLDITRQARGHLAFGHGVHHCVGAALARAEAEIALGRLFDRFDGLTLATAPEVLTWRDSFTIHSLRTLPVRLHG